MFIRAFLSGKGDKFGSPIIDLEKGAPQADIFYFYKLAQHRSYAENTVAYENEARIKAGRPIYSPEEYEERVDWHMRRIPYKLVSCRYHSFVNYCGMLKKLGWLEEVTEEPSGPQEYDPKFQPRRYYRLTKKGIDAPDYEWSNPKLTLYPQFSLEYHREKRKEHHYSRRIPTKSRRAVKVKPPTA
jgi:hypothetical protein